MENTSLQKFHDLNMNNRDPVIFLNEIFGKINCVSTVVTGVHNKCCFKVTMMVDGRRFTATGTTFKNAKKSCALEALVELCNIYYDPGKVQPFVHVPKTDEGRNINITLKSDKEESLMATKCAKEDKGNDKHLDESEKWPLTIEEIKDDEVVPGKERKKSNALRNITNLQVATSLNAKNSKKNLKFSETNSNLKNPVATGLSSATNCSSRNGNSKDDLGIMLSRKSNTRKITKKPVFDKKFSTLDVVNVETVETKTCVRSFARNPIEAADLNQELIEEVIEETKGK